MELTNRPDMTDLNHTNKNPERERECSSLPDSLFRMFNEIEANKVEGIPIEDCAACAGEGDMLMGENEWETCLNCGGLGYTEIENN